MPNLINMPNQNYLCQPPPKYAKFQKFGIKICQLATLLYFRSPRLATRFESNAANIAKVLVKALLNFSIQFNIQENQVVENSQDHISSVFSLKTHRQNNKNRFAIGRYTTMFLVANCLVSFLWGCAEDSPVIAKFIGKCAENVIA